MVASKLPPPLRPSAPRSDEDDEENRGSLSDYSDYESSDEETHNRARVSTSSGRGYVNASADKVDVRKDSKSGLLEDDPFADPFGDANGIDPDSSIDIANTNERRW